jgi:hypothetical protein
MFNRVLVHCVKTTYSALAPLDFDRASWGSQDDYNKVNLGSGACGLD